MNLKRRLAEELNQRFNMGFILPESGLPDVTSQIHSNSVSEGWVQDTLATDIPSEAVVTMITLRGTSSGIRTSRKTGKWSNDSGMWRFDRCHCFIFRSFLRYV